MTPRSLRRSAKRWSTRTPASRIRFLRLLFLVSLPHAAAAQNRGAGRPTLPVAPSRSSADARIVQSAREVDGEQLLTRLRELSVRSWQSGMALSAARHLGPTARDFRRAFGVGDSDTTIAPLDAVGVSLAAARALEARTRVLRAENAELREEVRVLRTSATATRRDLAALWSEVAALRRQDAARPLLELTSERLRTRTP